jgi:hypothetical protein
VEQSIPTYSAEGRRLRDYSVAKVEDLLSRSMVVVERKRNGHIKCAHLRPSSGASPVRKTAHMGQHYSFKERLPNGRRAWNHSKMLVRSDIEGLIGKPIDVEDTELFIRAVFRAVPLSIMPRRKTPALLAKDARRKGHNRPVEFDSQGRLNG